jgi:hypothetical protein
MLSHEDCELLRWLWRWKLLSTSAIQTGVYKTKTKNKTYRRLLHFQKLGLIVPFYSGCGKYCLWQLDDRGYKILERFWSENYAGGFRSENKNHDFWVTAIHLGEWITEIPENCAMISEQELRRWDYEEYPDWVPKTTFHRPDGYWCIDLSKPPRESLIALEVELSKKSPFAYREVGEFYSDYIDILEVIWVVKTKSDMNYIHRHVSSGSSTEASEHSYIFLDQFIEHQWQAKIEFGKSKGKTLKEVIGKSPAKGGSEGTMDFLLDLRKKPINSTNSTRLVSSDLGLNRYY